MLRKPKRQQQLILQVAVHLLTNPGLPVTAFWICIAVFLDIIRFMSFYHPLKINNLSILFRKQTMWILCECMYIILVVKVSSSKYNIHPTTNINELSWKLQYSSIHQLNSLKLGFSNCILWLCCRGVWYHRHLTVLSCLRTKSSIRCMMKTQYQYKNHHIT